MSIVDKLLHKMFGTPHARKIKTLRPIIEQIRERHVQYMNLHDSELVAKTAEFKEKLAAGGSLEDIKVDAFAVCQEACDRRLGMFNVFLAEHNFDFSRLNDEAKQAARTAIEELQAGKPFWEVYLPGAFYNNIRELYPDSVKPYRMKAFDVQLIGGLVLHEGSISEMATGEGKTLAAACPVYLNALTGKGVHVITVNDYLAGRDASTMGRVYKFLGLEVGLIVHGLNSAQRRASYAADVTYGTNNEFGFDYLRDNMAVEKEELVQRPLHYCIVDEVDSILIDEARTPLIISGPAEDATDKYVKAQGVVRQLKRDVDFTLDEKNKNLQITEKGVVHIEHILGITNLYGEHAEWVHFILQSLKANNAFVKDVDYIVREGEVIIVDENTGRLMEGRRYSDGLHQAIEAKEGVQIRRENQTLATITFQNFFRMYEKLSGMTGTAETEATEFLKIYNMPTWVIPTHKPCIRADLQDQVYKTGEAKWNAIVAEIKVRHEKGQPLLVGTVSIEKSEYLSQLLKREGIPHDVLNAKNHGREAEIIQLAGHKGRVTIATNMAGRGTDIALGPGVIELGGLHVLGTERHESRRIDNQLRGRSGRQGDPGSSQYFLSLDDDLMRVFGGNNVKGIMDRFGLKDDEVIEHPWVTKSIRSAQRRVEGQNFDSRKYLLDYDNVMNEQRRVIYSLRRRILMGEDVGTEIMGRIEDAVDIKVSQFVEPGQYPENWDMKGLETELGRSFGIQYAPDQEHYMQLNADQLLDEVIGLCKGKYDKLAEIIPPGDFRQLERRILLLTLDQQWKDHLYGMDHLRESTRFQGYAQKDPLMVYKAEGFKMFETCLETIATYTAMRLLNVRIEVTGGQPVAPQAPAAPAPQKMIENTAEIKAATETVEGVAKPTAAPQVRPAPRPAPRTVPQVNEGPKLGRNDPCWCGSGKKYKKCHGENE